MSGSLRVLIVCTCALGFCLWSFKISAQNTSQQLSSVHSTIPGHNSSIAGTVLDTNGDVIEGANVQLSMAGSNGKATTTTSGSLGQFEFEGLERGTYIVRVSRKGMTPYSSKPIILGPESLVTVPKVVLSVESATTTVTVMDKQGASIEQVEIAEQQRVFKVFPNFYSSFDWNAPPMLSKQKYHLASRTLIDPVTFLTTGVLAGAEQYKNVFPSFGGGFDGYAKRYGAAYANHASGELFTRAVFPAIFHTDPRYFIMGKGSKKTRALHAISSTFVTRSDNGARRVNFSEILGGLSSAALSNTYYPPQERGVNLVLINGLGDLGGDMLDNLIREFVLNRLTTRAKH